MERRLTSPSVVVLIPESTRKRRGGEKGLETRDDVATKLSGGFRLDLLRLREEVRAKSSVGSIDMSGLLPAYRRFDGNMYRSIPAEAWDRRSPDVEVLVVSGLFGVLASRDSIPWYEHSMAEPFPELGKLNRWWHDHGLPRILQAYLEQVAPKQVVDLLSLEYREAVAGFGTGLRGIPVKTIEFPGMGRASQPLRGEKIAEILRTGRV
jgi:Peroxide stress protein YaaA